MNQLNKKRAIIIGAGGHSRVIASMIISQNKYDFIKILDFVKPKEKKILNIDVEKIDKNFEVYSPNIYDFYLAIGDNGKREQWWKKLIKINASCPSLISDSAFIERNSKIGRGNIICANSYLGVLSKLGDNNIINSGSIIDHETIIENNCHIAPGATIAGRVAIQNNSLIGAGSVVKDNLLISENSILGAGSVLLNSMEQKNCLFAGVPAKFKREI
jgi:UDP-perosamine 4-acetyltransferase